MKYTLILILFFNILNINGQNYLDYYKLINQAEILTIKHQFAKSDSIYKEAFKIVEKPFKEDLFLYALNSEKMMKYELTNEYLIKAIGMGLCLRQMKNELSSFKSTKYWKEIKRNYRKLNEQFNNTINLKFSTEIKEMIRIDQRVRHPIFGRNKRMDLVDEQNFIKLVNLIKENNGKWIGFSTIGEITPEGKYDVTHNIVLLLLHFNNEQLEHLKPILLEAVIKGEMYPYHFARVFDYNSIKNSLITKIIENHENSNLKQKNTICQIYGTYFDTKICDCEIAEEKRREIGFEPIKDYFMKVNKNYECIK